MLSATAGGDIAETSVDAQANTLENGVDPSDQAEALDREHGFYRTGNEWENWGRTGEKWFRGGEDGAWHFMTPDGLIHQWNTPGKAEGRIVAAVDSAYYAHPDLLFSGSPTDGRNLFRALPGVPNLAHIDSVFDDYSIV